jgi:hypothetical protein
MAWSQVSRSRRGEARCQRLPHLEVPEEEGAFIKAAFRRSQPVTSLLHLLVLLDSRDAS